MIEAPTTQPIAMIDVAERSIWATIRTIMRPKAAMNSGRICRKMSRRLVGLRISGTKSESAAT